MRGLALQVQEGLGRDPFAGDIYVFRGRNGSLIKAIWHDGIGLSLYAKRLDRGRFIWPQTVGGAVCADGSPDGLFARRNRLAEPSANLATAGRRIGSKLRAGAEKRVPRRGQFVIRSASWKLILTPCRTTSQL